MHFFYCSHLATVETKTKMIAAVVTFQRCKILHCGIMHFNFINEGQHSLISDINVPDLA